MTRKTKRRQADSTKRETLQDCPDGQPGVSERMEIDPPSASGQGARLEELYTNLRDEVRGAAEELIVQFVPLVNSAVMGFISRRRGFAHLHDDLISEGYLSMTETVLGLKRPHDLIKDVRAYVLRAVYNAMDDHCNASHQVAPSVRTQYRKRNELDKKEIGQLDPEGPQDFGSEATKRVDEILGDIRECCKNDLEHRVVSLRRWGLTDRDIAEELDVPKSTVCDARKRVEARYNELAIGA